MINKKLEKITFLDLEELVNNAVPESKTIEYKSELSISGDNAKKEFLFDISSFANSEGGDLIFGIIEDSDTGYPVDINGIDVENEDKLKLQIDSMIRNGIAPRINSINYLFIPKEDKKNVLIIRIGKSWSKPHQVIFKGTDKFYSRGANGKYKLDVVELRNSFINSYSLRQNISKFRNDRLMDIISNNGSALLLDNGKIIFHIIPLISFNAGININPKELFLKKDVLRPLGEQGFLVRYNFDGILSYVASGINEPNPAYLQVFRNGIIETVDSWIIQSFQKSKKKLFIDSIEEVIIEFIHRFPQIYQIINIPPPYIILLTITGASDYELGSDKFYAHIQNRKVGKEVLSFPELLIEEQNVNLDFIIKPWFDSLWNAVGIAESKNYYNGKWVKQ